VRSATAAIVAVVATLLIWYAFYKLLRVPLPWGLLTSMAF
jgi:putative tricarboxylic transport membrane protein